MATVVIRSDFPSPVDLRVWRREEDSFREALSAGPRSGPPVTVRPGLNEVDADFWREWSKAHEGSDLAAHLIEQTEQRE